MYFRLKNPEMLILSMLSMLPAIIVGMAAWRRLNSNIRLFVLQIALSVLVLVLSRLHSSNHAIFNVYMLAEFLLLFFGALPYVKLKAKKVFCIAGFLLFGSVWITGIYINGINQFATLALITGSSILAVEYFICLLNFFMNGKFEKGVFIILFATFVFCCSIIPVISFLPYLIQHSAKASVIYNSIMGILSSTRYISIALGLYLIKTGQPKLTTTWKEV